MNCRRRAGLLFMVLSLMTSALAAQTIGAGGTFLLRRGTDTVGIERFDQTGDTARGSVQLKGQPRVEYVAVTGPDGSVRSLLVTAYSDTAADAAPLQRVRITMGNDSAFAEINGAVQRFATARWAVPFLNSVALEELLTRRARASGGSADIPVWMLAGAASLTATVRAIGEDSMVLTVAGVEERLKVDGTGRILGGVIPSQRVDVIRGDAASTAAVHLAISPVPLPAGITERQVIVPGPVALPGTLTLPAGNGPFPAVVLVHGSGPGDRDETVGANKPFRDLAWGLAQRGVAVLRYDKRAMVQPMWYANRVFTVYDETIEDALSALTVVRQEPEVNARRTFLVGLSLGGMLAPRIAKADGKLDGIVIMAGATRVQLVDQMDRQDRYLITLGGSDSAAVKAAVAANGAAIARVRALRPADSADSRPIPGLGGTTATYWLDLAAYDPARTMRDVHIPALVLQGMRDWQVLPEQVDEWLKGVGPRNNITVKRYAALNHLFIAGAGTPGPAEYANPGHVDPQVMVDIAAWIRLH